MNPGGVQDLEEDKGKRNKGENQEQEENVMAKEEVIGLVVGVVEPEGLEEGEIAAKRKLGGGEGVEGQHWVEESGGGEWIEERRKGAEGRETVKIMREF